LMIFAASPLGSMRLAISSMVKRSIVVILP
jgi:hypothetical protein